MRIRRTLVYFLIFTVISSAVAYHLVLAGYESLDARRYELSASSY